MNISKYFRILLPPVWVLVCTVAQILIQYLTSPNLPKVLFSVGIIFMASGFCLLSYSANLFRKQETPVKPFEETTKVVTSGFYRYSRNPMYLGMILMSTGCAFAFRNYFALLPTLGLYVVINYGYIIEEEKFLENLFGQEYKGYKNTVRRWI